MNLPKVQSQPDLRSSFIDWPTTPAMPARLKPSDLILIAQRLGLSLGEIEAELAKLPQGRTPDTRDWEAISSAIRAALDARIDDLTRTRDRLDGCIGCDCLSLEKCAIWNPQDRLGHEGPGPRKLLAQ